MKWEQSPRFIRGVGWRAPFSPGQAGSASPVEPHRGAWLSVGHGANPELGHCWLADFSTASPWDPWMCLASPALFVWSPLLLLLVNWLFFPVCPPQLKERRGKAFQPHCSGFGQAQTPGPQSNFPAQRDAWKPGPKLPFPSSGGRLPGAPHRRLCPFPVPSHHSPFLHPVLQRLPLLPWRRQSSCVRSLRDVNMTPPPTHPLLAGCWGLA